MASLVREQRTNPATGRVETYYKLGYREGKKQRRPALGFITQKEAETALARFHAKQLLGLEVEPPPASPTSSGSEPTIREWWGSAAEPWPAWPPCRMLDWIDARGGKPKTKRLADSARRVIVRELGDRRLRDIDTAAMDAFVAAMRRSGLASRTCQIYLDWLRRSLEVAVGDEKITAVPAFKRPADTDRRTSRWALPEQTAALLEELDRRVAAGITEPDAALAIRMQETLVMRPGEVLSRRWCDIHRDARWTRATLEICDAPLPDGTRWTPKNAESYRALAVPPELLGLLREHWLRQGQPRDGWIYPQTDRPAWPRTSVKKALAGACRAIGIPVLNPHALRHTGATRLAFAGMDRPTLMAIAGWGTGEMADEVYGHTTSARMAEALAAAEIKPRKPGQE